MAIVDLITKEASKIRVVGTKFVEENSLANV